MGVLRNTLMVGLILLFTASCSVMSRQIRAESEPSVGYRSLVKEVDTYIGKTVILGGYVLETENLSDKTTVVILQAPLGMRDEPKSKDDTEGRFIVSYKGWLDPLVYTKNRRITVAGVVVGLTSEKAESCPHPCLKIDNREIHLWPEYFYPPRHYWSGWPWPRHPWSPSLWYPYPWYRYPWSLSPWYPYPWFPYSGYW